MTFPNHLTTRVPTYLIYNFPKKIFGHLPKGTSVPHATFKASIVQKANQCDNILC